MQEFNFSKESQTSTIKINEADAKISFTDSVQGSYNIFLESAEVVHLTVQIGAHCDLQLQLFDQAHVAINVDVKVAVGTMSNLNWLVVELDQGNKQISSEVLLNGEGATVNSNVLAVTHVGQTQSFKTKVTNQARHTIGHIQQRGIAQQDSILNFDGIGNVVKGAAGSDAQQTSRLLMLDETATGDVNPVLLIDEEDVMAGHAASVGQVNKDQVYYLLSRGLTLETAQRLVTRGFIQDAMVHLNQDDQKKIYAEIERQLQNG